MQLRWATERKNLHTSCILGSKGRNRMNHNRIHLASSSYHWYIVIPKCDSTFRNWNHRTNIHGIGLRLMVHIVHHVSNRHSITVRENALALQRFVMQKVFSNASRWYHWIRILPPSKLIWEWFNVERDEYMAIETSLSL